MNDLRYALRTLARSPVLTLAAVLTLGLGIGANTVIFSVVDRLFFLAPAHVVDPNRVVRVYSVWTSPQYGTLTHGIRNYPRYADLRQHVRAFSAVAAHEDATFGLGLGEHARRVTAELVTASFFPLLGVRAERGRFFTEDEDRVGAAVSVAVVSYPFWQAVLGGSDTALGTTLRLGRNVYTVIGVAPDRFTGVGLREPDVWLPMSAALPEAMGNPNILTCDNCFWQLGMIARLAPAVSLAQAASEATAVLRDPADSSARISLAVARGAVGTSSPNASTDAKLSVWLAVVCGIVLLIACANVSNLLLVRAVQRRVEIAVRVALGASRARVLRQVYAESAILGAAGGAAALLITLWAGPVLRTLLLPDATPSGELDLRVVLFTVGVILVTAVLAGLMPALQCGVSDLSTALKSGAREGGSPRSAARSGLLVAQVALTLVLLAGAGLFISSLRHVRALRLGLDAEHLIVASVDFRGSGYKKADINAFYQRMQERVSRLAGVTGVSLSEGQPFGVTSMIRLNAPGVDSVPLPPSGSPVIAAVSPNYFSTLGTALRQGRAFTDADNAGAQRVVVVNETMARRVWPRQNPIGKCLVIGWSSRCSEVVGVVEDARQFRVTDEEVMQYFIPLAQGDSTTIGGTVTSLEVRTAEPADAVVGAVRREMQASSPALPYVSIDPMPQLFADQLRTWRLGSLLLGVFGALGLVLAAIGLYGVMSYNVSQRTQEMGVRIALGAVGGDVVGLVVRQGLRITLVGVALGIGGALAVGKVIAALLYGVSPHDPVVLLVVTILLLGVAALASYLPARRATKVDPMVALRYE